MPAPYLSQNSRWVRSRKDPDVRGVTRNPWAPDDNQLDRADRRLDSLGTAAGLVGFSIGTETLGSMFAFFAMRRHRVTANLRPRHRYGANGLSWTMDKIGPICRGVEDAPPHLVRSTARRKRHYRR